MAGHMPTPSCIPVKRWITMKIESLSAMAAVFAIAMGLASLVTPAKAECYCTGWGE